MKNAFRMLVVTLCLVFVVKLAGQEPKADASSPAKQFESGLSHLLGSSLQNVRDGLRLVRASADQGYVPAQDALGAIYNEGQFVTRDIGQSISWYKKSANQGDGIAASWVGYFYFTGAGVQRDLDAAKKWFAIAAGTGDPVAEYYLGLIAEQKDYTAAPALFKKSAEQGQVQAQLKLASVLDAGRGTKREPVESYVWLLVAAGPGNTTPTADISRLEAEIGTTEAQQARERAVTMQNVINRARNSLGCFDWPGREDAEPTPPPLSAQQSCRR